MIENLLPRRELVPAYYLAHEQSRAIIETLTDASLEAKEALEDVIDQFFVDTATWGLSLWEWQVGLQTDTSLSMEARRATVRQKLVARRNITEETVRDIAESITGYEARVIINSDYSFSLEFLGEKNRLVDINVDEVRTVVEQIKPAHLRFIISRITWVDMESVELTWQYFEDNPTTWAELEEKFRVHARD